MMGRSKELPRVGRRFAEFELQERLDDGGMGAIFRARDLRLERDVALRIIGAEVAGDACLRFDPLDCGAMARCMARLVDEPALREQLRAAGRVRAARFSWEEKARRTLEAYESALQYIAVAL